MVVYQILKWLNSKLLYQPIKTDRKVNHKVLAEHFEQSGVNVTSKDYYLKTADGHKIHCVLLTNNLKNNHVFLYSHGNAGNIDGRLICNLVLTMLNYGSVLLYDYRGFGRSSGTVTEKGLHYDIETMWNFLLEKYNPENIILYGESMGCTASFWLGSHLVQSGRGLPKGIIAQSGFSDIRKIADKIIPYSRYLILGNFNNVQYVNTIAQSIPMYVLHSKDDEVIDIDHAYDLANTMNCTFCEITGRHSSPQFNKEVYGIFKTLTS
jgi:fermentation-respiration switch protein FrsA (DUF1100 family)